MVKPKSGTRYNFVVYASGRSGFIFPALALLTFIFSWIGAYPPDVVERSYARMFFPGISHFAGRFADSVSFAWLDVSIPAGLILLVALVRKRRWTWLANVVAALYLVFFWTWGLNYHRQLLAAKLQSDENRTKPPAIEEFSRRAANELNRIYPLKQAEQYLDAQTAAEAAERVRHVVAVVDGRDWEAAHRIKTSLFGNAWMHAAGVDGVFNPWAHEPIVSNTVLDIERPFVLAHELAHVRGYPDEGDANVIALFATILSDDARFQYSGWLSLWLYLRTRELDKLLDPGPGNDLKRIFDRARTEEIRWISDFQRALLDWFLKANNVEQGVRSYSRVVLIAAGTEPYWARFR